MHPESSDGLGANEMLVEVCCAMPRQFFSVTLTLPRGATVCEAIIASQIALKANIVDWRRLGLGVYGKRRRPDDLVISGDRIELSRRLVADPKLARHRRVEKERRARRTAK